MALNKTKKGDDRNAMLAQIARLDRRGHPQAYIAKIVKVSQPQVSMHLKTIREAYKAEPNTSRGSLIKEKLHQYRELRDEAWQAWERSKQDAEKITEEELLGGEGGGYTKTRKTKEGRLPAAAYLQIVQSCLLAERELLAIDPPKELNVNQTVINWDVLAQVIPNNGPVPDVIEAEIVRALEDKTEEKDV